MHAEVEQLLESEAQAVDEEEDARYGSNAWRSLPEDIRRRQDRIAKIKQAKQSHEDEAKAKANAKRQAIQEQEEALKKKGKTREGTKTPVTRRIPRLNATSPTRNRVHEGRGQQIL